MTVSSFRASLIRLLEEPAGEAGTLDAALFEHLKRTYGSGMLLRQKLETLLGYCDLFAAVYGDGPMGLLRAPARINILGEHVDYVSYLPTASLTFGSREHEMMLLYRPSGRSWVCGRSTLENFEPFRFDLEDWSNFGNSVKDWERFLFDRPAPAPHWSNYVKGAACFARMKHGTQIHEGIDFLLGSSIPVAGGASSSSALTVLAGAALLRTNSLPCPPLELAMDSAKAEWFVGTRGGAMDHLTICLSGETNAVHISYAEESCELAPLPGDPYRWLTFFSHPADKSKEVMLEYNERAAVSRIWIPALLQDWATSDPPMHKRWREAQEALSAGNLSALNGLEQLLESLPEEMTLSELARRYPDAGAACARVFPALVREWRHKGLRLRARARHHVGEVGRVAEARRGLEAASQLGRNDSVVESVMRRLGKLLNASHNSLRDQYGVCTLEVDRLVEIITSHPGIYGARLMGGGFGGNVLVLTTEDRVPGLCADVQQRFYAPRGRNGERERSVMISTPGAGLSALDTESAIREQVAHFNAKWREADQTRSRLRRLLAQLATHGRDEVWPIIVAAGEGKRAKASGLVEPKPVTKVLGVPVVERVYRAVRAVANASRPVVVIVSPYTEAAVRAVLKDEHVLWVVQTRPLGTGDAVLSARAALRDFKGRALVVWGTQPVLQSETVSLSLQLADLFPDYSMVFPTATMPRPYTPVYRDESGRVLSARETHLEKASAPEYGEANVGLFVLWSEVMFGELEELRSKAWLEDTGCYDRPGGELGFPNEMIRRLAGIPSRVLASPIADWREEKGIKTQHDVVICEQYLRELEG